METDGSSSHFELRCDTAQTFIRALEQVSHQNSLTRGVGWIWRGVGDAVGHSLVPSALRPESWSYLLNARNLDASPRGQWTVDQDKSSTSRSFCEYAALSLFYRYANQQALPLPPVTDRWHNVLLRPVDAALSEFPRDVIGPKWPPRELWSVLALAQHYGVKTRLLDWTRNANIAAYFACSSALKRQTQGRLAVWRTDAGPLDATSMFSPPRFDGAVDQKCRVHVVDVPYSGNANLAAQSGRFTLCEIDESHPVLKFNTPLDVMIARLRDDLKDAPLGFLLGDPTKSAFLKLTAPTSEAVRIMSLLHGSGVDASRIFPGFGGCAAGLEEAMHIKSLLMDSHPKRP